MGKYSQIPPLLIARVFKLVLSKRVHFLKVNDITDYSENGSFYCFRKVIVDPDSQQPKNPGAEFRVYFQFSKFSVKTNIKLSLIPIPLIIAQPGFRSKAWFFDDDTGTFQGLYEWDSIEDAESYINSFPLKLMKKRAIQTSLKHFVKSLEN